MQWLRSQKPGLGLLLMWVVGSLLMIRILSGGFQGGGFQAGDRSQFETAFQWVSQTEADDAPSHRINQMTYNRWRRSQNLPYQSVSEITEDEAKSLYQTYWQQEHCDSYAAPLDATCLDTMVSFGMSGSRSMAEGFLANLPADPQAAAIAVVNRRIDYWQQLSTRYGDQPNETPLRSEYPRSAQKQLQEQLPRSLQTGVAEELRRDQELLAQVEAYQPPRSSNSVWALVSAVSAFFQQPSLPSSAPLNSSSPQPLSFDQILTKAEPFTVEVWITLEDGTSAPATGIIVADGLVLTNAHVVEGNPQPKIETYTHDRLQNQHKYSGQVIASDRSVDMALIQISGATGLPIAPLADSTAQVKVGDTVYALGSPVGFHWKLTTAQVIEVQSQCGIPELKCIRMPRNFLHPGNSGGPLLDATGIVIGINRAVQGSTGEGVSIPIEDIKRFLQRQGK